MYLIFGSLKVRDVTLQRLLMNVRTGTNPVRHYQMGVPPESAARQLINVWREREIVMLTMTAWGTWNAGTTIATLCFQILTIAASAVCHNGLFFIY